jgi:hypothetical protein
MIGPWPGSGKTDVVGSVAESYATWSISSRPMTQQYLIGQFSVLLEDLQPSTGDSFAAAVHDLRKEVERSSVPMLPTLACEAMVLSDRICWGALERLDASGFCRYVKAAVALGEFTDAAGLVSGSDMTALTAPLSPE